MDTKKSNVATRNIFADLLAACRQSSCSSNFAVGRWPLEPIASDEGEWEVGEHFFNDDANGNEKLRRLAELVKRGEIRICGSRRAMQYVAANRDIQKDHFLIIPVIAQCSSGGDCLPTFTWDQFHGHRIQRCSIHNKVGPHCGWLILRKRKT